MRTLVVAVVGHPATQSPVVLYWIVALKTGSVPLEYVADFAAQSPVVVRPATAAAIPASAAARACSEARLLDRS